MTIVCEAKKAELARLADELMSSQENVLKNVFYKLVPAQNCGDKVCDKFIGRYNKVYSVMLTDDEDGVSSIVLTWDIIDKMEIDFDDIRECAEENTPKLFPATIEPMGEVLAQFLAPQDLGFPIPNGAPELYVISNDHKHNGSASICYPGVLKSISETVGGSFWLLPSSVHELIALNADQAVSDQLRQMVKEINDTVLEPNDLLGYDVMFYDSKSGELEIA